MKKKNVNDILRFRLRLSEKRKRMKSMRFTDKNAYVETYHK